MPCLASIFALMFPRVMIVILWFMTDWFHGVFQSFLWPILGVLFAPFATLWYGVVFHNFQGEWNIASIAGMVVALAFDFGMIGSSARKRKKR